MGCFVRPGSYKRDFAEVACTLYIFIVNLCCDDIPSVEVSFRVSEFLTGQVSAQSKTCKGFRVWHAHDFAHFAKTGNMLLGWVGIRGSPCCWCWIEQHCWQIRVVHGRSCLEPAPFPCN